MAIGSCEPKTASPNKEAWYEPARTRKSYGQTDYIKPGNLVPRATSYVYIYIYIRTCVENMEF